ncbi:MAG: putative amino acid racemase [Paraglaciecola sp.]|jgi:predicted amino acid racemase
MYPRVEINLSSIKHNLETLIVRCKKIDIDVVAVVKLVCGDPTIIDMIAKSAISTIADSRLENFEKIVDLKIPKMMLRIPMLSQVNKLVDLTDISLNSEIETIRKISEAASNNGKVHQIILMIDLGDLREGIIDDDILDSTITEVINLEGVNLLGIGANLCCFGGVIPSEENMRNLVKIKHYIKRKHNINITIVSGGNSGTIKLLTEKKIPIEINQLRLGASIFMGIGLNDEKISGLKHDAFTLSVEIIEIMYKPSVPIGETGLDAFGEKPIFEDMGIRKKAICAIGRQDIQLKNLVPFDEHIKVLGMSSDHLILDISETKNTYKLGGKVNFELSYAGILSLMTSKYVNKVYL